MSENEATQAAIAAQAEALATALGYPAAPAAPDDKGAAPYGSKSGDPFGKGNEPAYTGKGTQTAGPETETETPSKGLDLSQLSVEYGNPDLGLVGAYSATGLGAPGTMGGSSEQPVFNPRTGKWVDPKTGDPVPPPTPSLFDMYNGQRN